MISYRSRINSTTKYSPYELVFGTIMNTFDPIPDQNSNIETDIFTRAKELKELIETKRPDSLKNIEKSQLNQAKVQDNRANVQLEPLATDTNVMIINDGIIPKLSSRYKGSYTIVSKDNLDNYTLKDKLGNIVPEKYPLHKLKVISSDEANNETAEIEKILDHKDQDGVKYYLVKWRNFPMEENEWVKEDDFHSKSILNKYLNKLPSLPKNKTGRGRGRPRKTPITIPNVLNIIALIFFLFGCVEADISMIKGNFKYCLDAYNKPPIDRRNICHNTQSPEKRKDLIKEFSKAIFTQNNVIDRDDKHIVKLDIYTKENNSVIGVGFECSVVDYHWSFGLTFFGYRWKTVNEEHRKLSPRECSIMTKAEECDGHKMTCSGTICEYRGVPEENYSMFRTIQVKVPVCILKQRTITALNAQSHLFGTNCLVGDYFCVIGNSIIVWERNIVKTCPFRRVINNAEFVINALSLTNEHHGMAFQYRGSKNFCGTPMIYTYEGAYITKGNNDHFYQKTDLPSDNFQANLDSMVQLNLASIDYSTIESRLENEYIFKTQCSIFEDLLYVATIANDKYFKFKDFKNNDIIIYSLYGELYRPECLSIDRIYFDSASTKCYYDFPITVTIRNKNVSAFLTHHGIIKTRSKEFKCIRNLIRSFHIPGHAQYLVTKNGFQSLVSENKLKLDQITFLNTKSDSIVSHDDLLQESFDFVVHDSYIETTSDDFKFPFFDKNDINTSIMFDSMKKRVFLLAGLGIILLACCFISCCQQCNICCLFKYCKKSIKCCAKCGKALINTKVNRELVNAVELTNADTTAGQIDHQSPLIKDEPQSVVNTEQVLVFHQD